MVSFGKGSAGRRWSRLALADSAKLTPKLQNDMSAVAGLAPPDIPVDAFGGTQQIRGIWWVFDKIPWFLRNPNKNLQET